MLVRVVENGDSFYIELTAEDKQDAAALVRMGMQSVKNIESFRTNVYEGGNISSYVHINKNRSKNCTVPRQNKND